MRISIAADEMTGVASTLAEVVRAHGHETLLHGALAPGEREDWAWASERAARDVAEGRAEQAIVCCWTGTGASIAANKVAGIRAALCGDAATAAGARRWNDANVLALSLRTVTAALLAEILDAWFGAEASVERDDAANIAHLGEIALGGDVQAQLSVRRGREAVEFYKRAFGASEIYRVGGDEQNEALVSVLTIGGRSFWVADESPEHANFSPETLGGATARMLLVVEDPDEVFARAIQAGAVEVWAPTDEYGWRLARVQDPYGHHWEIGRPPADWP